MRHIRRLHRGASPGVIDTSYFVDNLRFVRSLFKPGMQVVTEVPEACTYTDWESAHVQTVGSSHEIADRLPRIAAGWMSRMDGYRMGPGIYTRVFDEPSEYWCCLWTDGGSCAHVESMLIKAGSQWAPPAGEGIFLIHGRASGVAAPAHLRATGERPLTAETDVMLFHWNPESQGTSSSNDNL